MNFLCRLLVSHTHIFTQEMLSCPLYSELVKIGTAHRAGNRLTEFFDMKTPGS